MLSKKKVTFLTCGLLLVGSAKGKHTMAIRENDFAPFFSFMAEHEDFLHSLPIFPDMPSVPAPKSNVMGKTMLQSSNDTDDWESRHAEETRVKNAMNKFMDLTLKRMFSAGVMAALPKAGNIRDMDILTLQDVQRLIAPATNFVTKNAVVAAHKHLVAENKSKGKNQQEGSMKEKQTKAAMQLQQVEEDTSNPDMSLDNPFYDICDLRYKKLFRSAWKQFFDLADQHAQDWQPWFGDSFRNVWGSFEGIIEDSVRQLEQSCQQQSSDNLHIPEAPSSQSVPETKTAKGISGKQASSASVCSKKKIDLLDMSPTVDDSNKLSVLFERLQQPYTAPPPSSRRRN